MYIKTTKNAVGQSYYHLVESYWEEGRSRQRTLLSLGRVENNRIDELAGAIERHQSWISAIDLAKSISIQETFVLGPLLLLEKLFERVGINEQIGRIRTRHPKLTLDLQKSIFTLVASRFIRPGSKLSMYEHLFRELDPNYIATDLELHQIYRTLDLLCEHKEDMEQGLYWHGRDLFTATVDVVLYDLTTLRFESTRTDLGELRQFGYSKEMRTDCTQVVLGLLLDLEGIPLGFEVYPGNTMEGKTLHDIVEKMRERFRVRRFIFVADRGLFSADNVAALKTNDGEFIVGLRLGVFKQRADEFYDRSGFQWVSDKLAIYETTHGGDRCIVTWSKVRAERDRKTREDILAKIQKKLSSKKVNAKTFVSNRNYQRYVSGLSEGKPTLNEKAIAQDARKDGFFGILTNVKDFSAQEAVMHYKDLWKIEDAFGEFKGTLRARPIFHWTDPRIIGHLTICFLAYLLEAHLTKMLRQKGKTLQAKAIEKNIIKSRPLTVFQAMRELANVRSIPVRIQSKTLWVRTDISGNAALLFEAAGVRIPPKVLRMDPPNPAGTNSN
jgi:transposase